MPNQYKHVALITTCRNSYVPQVFGAKKTNPSDVHNSMVLKGFDNTNIDKVIEKYFAKYNVTITNEDYPKNYSKIHYSYEYFPQLIEGER